MLVDAAVVSLTLWLLGGTLVSVAITWAVTMVNSTLFIYINNCSHNNNSLFPQGHLVAGYVHVMYSNKIHPIAWTIPHCVLVLKMIGIYVCTCMHNTECVLYIL